jgi:serine/threonine-protein kinase RsbW
MRPKDFPAEVRSFPADPSVLYLIRRFLAQKAAEARLSKHTTENLLLAVTEACANALRHTLTPDIHISLQILQDRVQVEIRDQGVFRKRVPEIPPGEGGGFGVPLMLALTDEISLRQGTEQHPGTVVRLVKYEETGSERFELGRREGHLGMQDR